MHNVSRLTIPEGEVARITCNGTVLWQRGYINRVPRSIDTDGSIYQGKGYIDGYRLSSSGGLSAQANTATTGFIAATASDVIRMAGAAWQCPGGFCYLAFYDAAFALLGSMSCTGEGDESTGYARGIVKFKNDSVKLPTIQNGVTTFDNHTFTDGSKIAYIRVNGYGSGADMIVTLNEEIS